MRPDPAPPIAVGTATWLKAELKEAYVRLYKAEAARDLEQIPYIKGAIERLERQLENQEREERKLNPAPVIFTAADPPRPPRTPEQRAEDARVEARMNAPTFTWAGDEPEPPPAQLRGDGWVVP